MQVINVLKKCGFLRILLLYLYHKIHNRKLVKFWYSTHLSSHCIFEGLNMVCNNSSFYGKMGLGSYIGSNCHLNAYIGRFSSIAPGVHCINASHPMKEPFVTTCPLFYSLDRSKNPQKVTFAVEQLFDEFRYYDSYRKIDVNIGNDCWIGENATFIGGVEISDGAVVLADALVVKDVPPYAIVGGTPAKIIGYRYAKKEIDFLQSVKWWENDVAWIEENWRLMSDFNLFKRYFNYEKYCSENP